MLDPELRIPTEVTRVSAAFSMDRSPPQLWPSGRGGIEMATVTCPRDLDRPFDALLNVGRVHAPVLSGASSPPAITATLYEARSSRGGLQDSPVAEHWPLPQTTTGLYSPVEVLGR
jgi:hypothetical protein